MDEGWSYKKYLQEQIANFQKTLDEWVDEHPDIHPVVMKASKDAVIFKLEEFKTALAKEENKNENNKPI